MQTTLHARNFKDILKDILWETTIDKKTTEVTVSGDVGYLNSRMLKKFEKVDTVIIENGVKSINTHAFENLPHLRSLTIPPSVIKLVDENADYVAYNYNINSKLYKSLRFLLDKEKITKLTLAEGFRNLSEIPLQTFRFMGGPAGHIAVIGEESYLFENFPHVEELILPSSIKEIKNEPVPYMYIELSDDIKNPSFERLEYRYTCPRSEEPMLHCFNHLKSLTVHKGTKIEEGAVPKGVKINYI